MSIISAPPAWMRKDAKIFFHEKDRARNDLIKEVVMAWYQVDPGQAHMFAKYLKEITKAELNKGWWKSKNGYVAYRMPGDLFHSLRAVIPNWGDDDKDLQYLCEEYPDLFGNKRRSSNRHAAPKR
jgi:hypothetical protein